MEIRLSFAIGGRNEIALLPTQSDILPQELEPGTSLGTKDPLNWSDVKTILIGLLNGN